MPRSLLKSILVLGGLALIGLGYFYMTAMTEDLEYTRVIQLAMRSMGLIIAGSVVSVVSLLFMR